MASWDDVKVMGDINIRDLEKANKIINDMVRLLIKIEYCGNGELQFPGDISYCPVCYKREPIHKNDCEMGRLAHLESEADDE